MLLRSFDFAKKYFDYKSNTEFEDISNPQINGWYKFVDGQFSALLVIDFNVYFLYGEQKILINESKMLLIKKISNNKSEAILIDGNEILVKFLYELPDTTLFVSPFEYIDEDDLKWGEFIAKIVNDRERQRNFVTNLMEGY
ncbi:hypothetical protein [Chishuiella changwenlii]|uniref:hypothetical protein n=1 Tax=Chishuiella changwenlii TaxID=1434701 RepID=UPI002FD98C34